jgi:hypothetical protein
MPLKPTQILHLLQDKRDEFADFDAKTLHLLKRYREALAATASLSAVEMLEQLSQVAPGDRGAELLEVLDNSGWVIPSGLAWDNREASLTWARQHITGITTFAVDGSQIYPSKDFSIPVALVQIGWYQNSHRSDGHYEKDVAVDVMTPTSLKVNNSGEPVDRRVNMRRFELETERIIQFMADHTGCTDCLALFDGSLVVTFAEALDETARQSYVRCVAQLLQASEHYQVPVVGYIDTTYAHDLTLLLRRLWDLPDSGAIHDAMLIGTGMQWGDRTPLFCCRRPGVLQHYPAPLSSQIGFIYLKAHDGYPVRLELPIWIQTSGQLEHVLNWVRSEIIVGGGYPYAIETADQTAVLQAGDRQTFYRIVQDWAEQERLNLRLSRKMVSKARRR